MLLSTPARVAAPQNRGPHHDKIRSRREHGSLLTGPARNEHVVGRGWPPVTVRHEMLVEAWEIIGALFAGGYVSRHGEYYQVDSATLWDLPHQRVPIAVAVSGRQSCELFAPLADHMIAVQPEAELGRIWDAARPGVVPAAGSGIHLF